jgi:TPR repeat protein
MEAEYLLGVLLNRGQGVVQDKAQAFDWFARAAAQGHGLAMYNLAVGSAKGEGMPEDPVQALKWFILATTHDSIYEEAPKIARDRDLWARTMSTNQVAEAHRLADSWQPLGVGTQP